MDLVYSTAFRRIGDHADLAKEVVQLVFIDLTHKAKSFPQEVIVSGWLYRHTLFVASKLMRTEQRRAGRERVAAERMVSSNDEAKLWARVRVALDEAMVGLREADRNAIILRFFDEMSLSEVGKVLDISEDAARMRVGRALERLRRKLSGKGIASSTSSLAAVLAGSAVSTAPSGLVAGICASALSVSVGTTGIGIGILGLTHIMKLKMTVMTALIGIGVGTSLWVHHNSGKALELKDNTIQQLKAHLSTASEENERMKNLVKSSKRSEDEIAELLQLRGEVGNLQRRLAEAAINGVNSNTGIAENESEEPIQDQGIRYTEFNTQFKVDLNVGETAIAGGWESIPGKRRRFLLITPDVLEEADGSKTIQLTSHLIEVDEGSLEELGLPMNAGESTSKETGLRQVIDASSSKNWKRDLFENSGVEVLAAPSVTTISGMQSMMTVSREVPPDANEHDGDVNNRDPIPNLFEINVIPTISEDGSVVSLTVLSTQTVMDESGLFRVSVPPLTDPLDRNDKAPQPLIPPLKVNVTDLRHLRKT